MNVYTWDFASFGYGAQWRICRRLVHEFLNVNAVSRFDNHLNKHTCRFLSRLAETPAGFLGHIRLSVFPRTVVITCPHLLPILSATGALIMEMTYGMDIKSHEDKFLQAAERALHYVDSAMVPGAFLVDTFPICLSADPRIPVAPG